MKAIAIVPVLSCLLLIPARETVAQGVTDAQIAAIVVTANQVDIDAGKLGESRAMRSDVRAFAKLMITDHTAVNKLAVELAKKLKLTPEANATSRGLQEGGEKHRARLATLEGAAFDRAYVEQEVVYHQHVLDALDKVLIPGAANAELKALLVKVRPAFAAHLEHAKNLRASLGQGQ